MLVGSSVNKFTKQKLEWKLKLHYKHPLEIFFPDLVLQPENIYKEKLLHEFRDLRIKKTFTRNMLCIKYSTRNFKLFEK